MTNYMGKARIIKLFYHYISAETEFIASFKKAVKSYGKNLMFVYRKYKGSEWLDIEWDGYQYHFYIFGQSSKCVTLDEKRYDETIEEYVKVNRIVSYYDKDFSPMEYNKDKSLDCYEIVKRKAVEI